MEVKYITSWGFAYREVSGESAESSWRRIDFQQDNPAFKTGNVIVYIEFDFPPKKAGEAAKKPTYSGKFIARKIKQTIRTQKGIAKGYVAILLKKTKLTRAMKKEARGIIDKYAKEGKLIPLP